MVDTVDTATARLWGEDVGVVAWEGRFAAFEYTPAFLKKGLEISPLQMNVEKARQTATVFRFPRLNRHTYLGLPGLLADSLPDKFGNLVINAWLARKGRSIDTFSPIERLCYMGTRGMGALEFFPSIGPGNLDKAIEVEVAGLVNLAQQITADRLKLDVALKGTDTENTDAILDILRVGTSAGGARPKAIIAMNQEGHVISGQGDVPNRYDHWILKFDGVNDLELGQPQGYGRIEYAYHLMARAAGIDMTECRLIEENGRAHFLTRRFDRMDGQKIHKQSLCGMAHYDFNIPGTYGYEQAFSVIRQLRLPHKEAVQQYRRMLFNVIARNHDDHTKNIGFLMGPSGKWKLSPAFDVSFSYRPDGVWTSRHQMTINGKNDDFTLSDLVAVGESISVPKPKLIIQEVIASVARWPEFAKAAGVPQDRMKGIQKFHRLSFDNIGR